MKRVAGFTLAVWFVCKVAVAATRSIAVDDAGVQVNGLTYDFLPDAGCRAQASYTVPQPLRVDRGYYAINGAPCAAERQRAGRAAFTDLGWGDGGAP